MSQFYFDTENNRHKSFELPGAKPHYNPDRPGQVEHIFLDIKLDIPKQSYQGTCTITLNPIRSGIESLTLDAVNLNIASVEINGNKQKFDYDSEQLHIHIDANAAPSASPACYPLQFRPMIYEKVWGGRALEKLGKTLPGVGMFGESWELADLAATSASGAGGGAARSVIASGALAGRTLGDAIQQWGADLLGRAKLAEGGTFPLLIKFLDARENLSVQVHPSPRYALAHPAAKLKTECWYILHAEPGSVIYKGIKPGITPEALGAHIRSNTVTNDLIAVPAIAGQCHNLPSGTCHALGAGVLVAEVQTPSDTTFRVYDWGRTGRQLHIAEALACIDFGPAPAATSLPDDLDTARLVSTEFFTLDAVMASTGEQLELARGAVACEVLIIVKGGGMLRSLDDQFAPVRCELGSTTLIPHAILSGAAFYPESQSTLLRAVPK